MTRVLSLLWTSKCRINLHVEINSIFYWLMIHNSVIFFQIFAAGTITRYMDRYRARSCYCWRIETCTWCVSNQWKSMLHMWYALKAFRAFVCLCNTRIDYFCPFSFPLHVMSCHGLTAVCDCGTPWIFLFLTFFYSKLGYVRACKCIYAATKLRKFRHILHATLKIAHLGFSWSVTSAGHQSSFS